MLVWLRTSGIFLVQKSICTSLAGTRQTRLFSLWAVFPHRFSAKVDLHELGGYPPNSAFLPLAPFETCDAGNVESLLPMQPWGGLALAPRQLHLRLSRAPVTSMGVR